MTQIVEEVVAAMTPVIDEIKQELTYVKEELGKMKNEELAEVKEKLSSGFPAANAIKHSPEVKKVNQNLILPVKIKQPILLWIGFYKECLI